MDAAFRAESWQVWYATVAGASAALTGLLFVGLSVNLRRIAGHPAHRAQAREAFGAMLALLVLSLLVLIPGQPRQLLGTELLAWGLGVAAISATLVSRTLQHFLPDERPRRIVRTAPLHLGTVALLIAGGSLLLGQGGGLFWLVPTTLTYLAWALSNAWQLTMRVGSEDSESPKP